MQKLHRGNKVPTRLSVIAACILGTVSQASYAVDAAGLLGKEIKIETRSDRGQYLWFEDGATELRWNGSGDTTSDFKVVAGAQPDTIAMLHIDTGKYLSCVCSGSGQLIANADIIGDFESYTVVDRGDDNFALVAANDKAVYSAFGSSAKFTRAFTWSNDPTSWEAQYTYEPANRPVPDTSAIKGEILGQTIRLKTVSDRGAYLWIEDGFSDSRWDGEENRSSIFEVVEAGTPDLIALRHLPTGKYLRCYCTPDAPSQSGALVLGSDHIEDGNKFLISDHGDVQLSLTAPNGKAVFAALGNGGKIVRAFSWAGDINHKQAQYTYEIVDLTREDKIFDASAPSSIDINTESSIFVSFDVTEERAIHFVLADTSNNVVFNASEQVDDQASKDFKIVLPELYSGNYEWQIFMSAVDDNTPISEVFTQSVMVNGVEFGDLDGDGDIDKKDTKAFNTLLKSGEPLGAEYDFNGDGKVDKNDYKALRALCTYDKCKVSLTLSEELVKARETLSTLIALMEDDGIDVEKEKMTLYTADIFLKWADWDAQHPDILQSHYSESGQIDIEEAAELAAWLPNFEREGARDIMQEAIDRLKKMRRESLVRRPGILVDYSRVDVSNQNLTQDGKPVFLADYTWKPLDPEFTRYYGAMDGHYIAPNFIQEDGSPRAYVYQQAQEQQETTIGAAFLSQNAIPNWIKENYPEIEDGIRIYGKYDIDHPASRQLLRDLFRHFSPLLKGKKFSELGYMLFNEPSYFTEVGTWNTGIVSQYTLDNYETWLSEKHGDISTLNNLWGSTYVSFDDVNETIPMPRALQGTPRWMDWMTFNNHRVTDFFAFMNNEIRKYDPDANSHAKLMPWLFSDAARDHGVDFEAITNLNTITSFDAGMQDGLDFGYKSWVDKYSFDWQTSLLTFDFLRSVKPDNVMYDSENHFILKSNYKNPQLNPDYVRAAYWSGFTSGIDATKTWVWSRNPDGSLFTNRGINSDFVISITQNPKVLHEITETVMDLNSYAEEITAIQHNRQPIRMFYSSVAGINSRDYMPAQRAMHESLYFEGEAIGFVTENILATQDVNWDVVVVHKTPMATLTEFNQLQAYLDQGGTVVIDDESFQTDEYGQAFPASLYASSGQLITANTATDATHQAMTVLTDKNTVSPVRVQEYANDALRTTGEKKLMIKQVSMADGKIVMSIVNTGLDDVDMSLESRADGTRLEFTSMLEYNQKAYMTTLKPFDVKLIEVLP